MSKPPRDQSPKDSHYARLRRQHREQNPVAPTDAPPEGRTWLYGLHTVRAAIANPNRTIHKLMASKNAMDRLTDGETPSLPFAVEIVHPREIDAKLGSEAVHQGVMIETDILAPKTLEDLYGATLVVVLDQITDPHNVGALIRSAVAMKADALVTTARHSPAESGVLAKAASGGLEFMPIVHVRNLANALTELNTRGFQTIGLDSEGPDILETTLSGSAVALVLGSEGKGLREKTRQTVKNLARLDMPGEIKSLNVSNAAVLSLYIARTHLNRL